MILRFPTLIFATPPFLLYRKALFFILLIVCSFGSYSQSSTEELKKEANKLYEEEDYVKAYKLYSQLVSNFSKDPEYNFRLGVCMIYAEPDKKKCLPYLQFAYTKPEAPAEVKFYLGKAKHINYYFDEALKYYNEFKKVASSSQQKKLQVDREIKACVYGKRLLSNLSDLVVQSKKQLNEGDYFRTYDLSNIGGKLLTKPEDFKSSTDKKKKDKSIVYLPASGNRVYYSSYGDDDNRDIYYRTKLPNGTYSPPQKVTGINSEFDEDYPFLHPNGNTLYFASKGHNGMGGYDIFKSTYIESSDSWSQPVNMEFPVNSPDDDYLYVTDSLEKTAYFSTGRQSLPGKIDVLKISTERKPIDVLAIKGTVVKENADQSLKSRVTVKNMDNGMLVGVFEAEDNGDYLMDLPNGAKLLYTVETPGLKTQSDKVALPFVSTSKPLRQTISYDNGILKIINYFDETASDDSYIQYLKIIEKKAKLDVNQGQNRLDPTLIGTVEGDPKIKNGTDNGANTNTDGSNAGNNTSVTTKTTSTEGNSKKGLDNKQLSDLAWKDAEESSKAANQLKNDAEDAKKVGNDKIADADRKFAQADSLTKIAETSNNEEEKKNLNEQIIALKKEAQEDKDLGTKMLAYSNALKEDGELKAKEADLNKQYAETVGKTTGGKPITKETVDKLDELQKQIEEVSKQKNKSEELFTQLKTDAEEKEKQASTAEKSNETLKTNIDEIKEAITSTETDLKNTKKKKDREPLEQKLNELRTELSEKEKQLAENEEQIKKIKEDAGTSNKGVELVTKIKNETIVTPTATTTIAASNPNNTAGNNTSGSQKITSKTLAEKYNDKIIVTDNSNKGSIEQSNAELKNYNKEVDAAISKAKSEIARTTNAATKQQLQTELKQLEATKKQNQQKIAANTKRLDELTTSVAANKQKNEIKPVNTSTNEDALKGLDNLNNSLNTNDNANFDYNAYQDPAAQKLKVDADSKINDAAAGQKKLKDLIASTKTNLQNSSGGNSGPKITPADLNREAEEYNVKAFDLRSLANTKTGKEKEDLLAQAKTEENKANEKSLQASDLAKADNKIVYDIYTENIKVLIADNKASEADLNEAKKLTDEAETAFKQAASLREEASTLSNTGAKLGTLSNAEEKEAEALNKQKQAIDLLKTSSPGLSLKTPVTSTTTTGGNSGETQPLSTQLSEVNKAVEELLKQKIDAYQKLYEANQTEMDQLISSLKSNQASIDKTPALKTDFISANNKVSTAGNLKQSSDASTDNNKKLNDITEATKKQIDALNQFNKVSKAIEQVIAKNTTKSNSGNNNNNPDNSNTGNATGTSTSAATPNTNTTVANTDNGSVSNSTVSTSNTNTSSSNTTQPTTTITGVATTNTTSNTQGSATKTISSNDNGSVSSTSTATSDGGSNTTTTTANTDTNTVNTSTTNSNNGTTINTETTTVSTATTGNNGSVASTTVDIKTLAQKDTSAADVASYLDNNKTSLKNPVATALVNKSLNEIKNTEAELKKVEEEINNASQGGGQTATQLKSKSDNLQTEAEEMSVKAFDLKTLANSKTGQEKDSLLQQAKNLEDQSQSKKLEAVKLTEEGNNLSYTTNKTAISDLMARLKTDNPELAAQLEEKNSEVNNLKTKSQQLREEANSQTNNNAKIGSMMNAEEKEAEMLIKQNEILAELKKAYPDYVVKESTTTGGNSITPEVLTQKQTQLREKQFTNLTNLTNGFSLEYETSKNNLSKDLNDDQKTVKQNADDLNAESKRLLIQSAQEKDVNEKTKLLTLAVKTGNAAVDLMNKLPKSTPLANNTGNNTTTTGGNNTAGNPRNTTGNNAGNTDPGRNNNPDRNQGNAATNRNPANNTTGRTIKVEGLEVIAGNAYNENNPIPVDAKVPDGIVIRVQIGAFKNKLPNNTFKGLSPVNAETAPNGYIRYTAGNFSKLETANAVKNDLRNLGYSDAFVVVFYNGKRIPLNEALDILAKEGKSTDNSTTGTAGINANTNIPKATTVLPSSNQGTSEPVTVTKEHEQMNGLLYTVQIGVYNKQATKRQLFGLSPIYTEKLPNGLYRYTAGIYNNTDKLITDKSRVVSTGIRDAFVSAYLNGKRISFADGKIKQQDSTTKMEPENPIVFPSANTTFNAPSVNTTVTTTPNTPTNNGIQPFSNGVTSYPAPTPENGVKTTEEGITFKVQIGAYSKQVPKDVAAKFSSIRTWPIENKFINGLYIYNIGNFSEARFAKALKEEAVKSGITDAFITVYKDGKKLYGPERAQYLGQ